MGMRSGGWASSKVAPSCVSHFLESLEPRYSLISATCFARPSRIAWMHSAIPWALVYVITHRWAPSASMWALLWTADQAKVLAVLSSVLARLFNGGFTHARHPVCRRKDITWGISWVVLPAMWAWRSAYWGSAPT